MSDIPGTWLGLPPLAWPPLIVLYALVLRATGNAVAYKFFAPCGSFPESEERR